MRLNAKANGRITLSIKTIRCRTVAGAIKKLDTYVKNTNNIFRGHKKRSYRLETTLFRDFKYVHNASWKPFIDNKLYDFRSRLAQIGIIPFESDEKRDWMEYARHQGLPTPYIDFTLSPYVALFFAITGSNPYLHYKTKDKYCVVYILNIIALYSAWVDATGKSNFNNGFNKFNLEDPSFFEPIMSSYSFCPTDTMKLFFMPSVFNRRMLAQKAVLLYDTIDYKRYGYNDLEDIIDKYDDSGDTATLTKLLIPKTLASGIFEELERRNIFGCSLFQSAEGIIQDLINEHYYCRATPSPRIPLGMDYWRQPVNIEKYRIEADDSFLKFYDSFLQNSMRGKEFSIKFTDGTQITGVPSAGSLPDMRDPHFLLKVSGANYRIPFREIVDATEV